MASGLSPGARCSISAATPLTWAAENEVPEISR